MVASVKKETFISENVQRNINAFRMEKELYEFFYNRIIFIARCP